MAIDRTAVLVAALARYRSSTSPHYDEAVFEVSERARVQGGLGKADVGALVLWKRLNASTTWAAAFMATPEDEVRAATERSRLKATDEDLKIQVAASGARSALASLPGFSTGDALASAVIYALAPERMAVYDRRAQRGLEHLGLELTSKPGRYGRYMGLVEALIEECRSRGVEFSAREVDLALYELGEGPR